MAVISHLEGSIQVGVLFIPAHAVVRFWPCRAEDRRE